MLVYSRNITAPIDAETVCFLDVIEYVRADTQASESCRQAVSADYGGNGGKPIRDRICRMTDYVRTYLLTRSHIHPPTEPTLSCRRVTIDCRLTGLWLCW